jgi:hypothetical protein
MGFTFKPLNFNPLRTGKTADTSDPGTASSTPQQSPSRSAGGFMGLSMRKPMSPSSQGSSAPRQRFNPIFNRSQPGSPVSSQSSIPTMSMDEMPELSHTSNSSAALNAPKTQASPQETSKQSAHLERLDTLTAKLSAHMDTLLAQTKDLLDSPEIKTNKLISDKVRANQKLMVKIQDRQDELRTAKNQFLDIKNGKLTKLDVKTQPHELEIRAMERRLNMTEVQNDPALKNSAVELIKSNKQQIQALRNSEMPKSESQASLKSDVFLEYTDASGQIERHKSNISMLSGRLSLLNKPETMGSYATTAKLLAAEEKKLADLSVSLESPHKSLDSSQFSQITPEEDSISDTPDAAQMAEIDAMIEESDIGTYTKNTDPALAAAQAQAKATQQETAQTTRAMMQSW